jgi:membrane-bound lytic murein transglycosylase D
MDSARVDLTAPDSVEIDTNELVEPTPVAQRHSYRVKRGETLSQVARKLGLSVSELKRLNRIKGSRLQKGQTLVYFKLAKASKKYNKRSSFKNRKKTSRKKKKTKSKKRRKRR